MLIDRDVRLLSVSAEDTVEDALRRITENQRRAVFCTDAAGVLVGIVTDGDFRRWLLAHPGSPLSTPVAEVANRTFVSAPLGADGGSVEALFSSAITLVPLLDERGRLVAVARPRTPSLWLETRLVDVDQPCLVVAEIGINHNGRLDVAKDLVDVAVAAGADCAKFQMRDMASLYRNAGSAGDFREDLGPQYTMDLLDRFSLTVDEMVEVFDHCRGAGILPLCTPWDEASANVLDEYGIPGYKVASADLTNHELLAVLAETARPVIMSTGMSTEQEIVDSVDVLRSHGSAYALLHCNSTYPAPYRDVHLRYMDRLAELGDCIVGYSGHERGFHVPVAAVARGAKIIEKHITLDRSWEGNDHKVSLLPDELTTMVRQIRDLEEVLDGGEGRRITQGEMMNRVNLAKSLVAARPISAGETITRDMVEIRSPGRGIQPNRISDLVGRVAHRAMQEGEFFFLGDLQDGGVAPRHYKFRRPWGLPVRYHDYRDLAARSNPDLLEFHMSYRDLELDVSNMVPEKLPIELIVHSPELFQGDHLMDLAADDESYRQRSISELQRVIDVTRELSQMFTSTFRPKIIVNVGGFSSDQQVATASLQRLYDRVADAFASVNDAAVEVLPQTMPPFPWLMGGQRVHNLFVDPGETARFARDHGRRICLDISHTKLACNHRTESFAEAVETLAPFTAHVHIVDAAGLDDEGLQIGDGEVDFKMLASQLDRLAPTASFIPEIWQGHQNGGEGFWVALDRLERYL